MILTLTILLIIVFVFFLVIGLQLVYGQAATTEGLEPLPQDYYRVVLPPNGIVVQDSNLELTDIAGIGAMISAGVAYVKGHLVGKKTEKVAETTRQQSAQIVKGVEVAQVTADTMFRLAPEEKVKEMEGTAPEIKLETLAKNKEEAVKTATEA